MVLSPHSVGQIPGRVCHIYMHITGLAKCLHCSESFPGTVLSLSLTGLKQKMLPLGTLSLKPEISKSGVDHKRVATTVIFQSNQRITLWGTQPFGDHTHWLNHQGYPLTKAPSLPSPPFMPCHLSLLAQHHLIPSSWQMPTALFSNIVKRPKA